MSRQELRDAVLALLRRIAPETDATAIRDDAPLRDQVDLDSIDFVNLVISIDEHLGVDIPEADYQRVATLETLLDYLEAHGARAAPIGAPPGTAAGPGA